MSTATKRTNKPYFYAYEITKRNYPNVAWHMIGSIILLLIGSLSQSFMPVLLGNIVNEMSNTDRSAVTSLISMFVFIWFLTKVVDFASAVLNNYIGYSCQTSMLTAVVPCIYKMPYGKQKELNVGVIQKNIDRCASAFHSMNYIAFVMVLPVVVGMLFSTYFIYQLVDLLLASLFLFTLVFVVILSSIVSRKTDKLHSDFYAADNALNKFITSRLLSLFDIKINQAYETEEKVLKQELSDFSTQSLKSFFTINLYALVQILPIVIFLFVATYYLANSSQANPGDFVTVITYVLQFTQPVMILASGFIRLRGDLVSLQDGLQYIPNDETTYDS